MKFKALVAYFMVVCICTLSMPNIIWAEPHDTNTAVEASTKNASGQKANLTAKQKWWFDLPNNAEYFEHDFIAVKNFLEQKNESGKRNGEQLNTNYKSDDPRTWVGVAWEEDESGTWYVCAAEFSCYMIGADIDPRYKPEKDLELCGNMDFSGMEKLRFIKCNAVDDKNSYGTVNLSGCPKLEEVLFDKNTIETLDAGNSPELFRLYVKKSGLDTLILKNNTGLCELYCEGCDLTTLPLSECTKLQTLEAQDCKIESLNLSYSESLNILNCSNNKIKSLDFTNVTETLFSLDVSGNYLGDILDCSKFSEINTILCKNCGLRELYLPKHDKELTVIADGNLLTKLDAKSSVGLEDLHVSDNYLTELDVSDCSTLRILMCNNNLLTSLKLGVSDWFDTLLCSNNYLTEIEIPNSAVLFYRLECQNNYIKSLDLSAFSSLEKLNCANNLITELNLSGQLAKKNSPVFANLNCSGNPLREISYLPIIKDNENFRITVDSEGGGYASAETVSDNGYKTHLLAEAEEGCNFTGWYDGTKLLSTDIKLPVKEIDCAKVTAKFSGSLPADFESKYEKSDFVHPLYTQEMPDNAKLNSSDVAKIKAFMDIKDESGITNGEKFMTGYAQSKPENWNFVKWELVEDEWRATALYLDSEINNETQEYISDNRAEAEGVLDLSGMNRLISVFADKSNITGADFENCSALCCIAMHGNSELSSLNINGCSKLWFMDIEGCNLQLLDIDGMENLLYLDVSQNKLQNLDKLANTNIETLSCSNNAITDLDVSGCLSLVSLECDENNLQKLSVEKCTKLHFLDCSKNDISELKIAKDSGLGFLDCSNNNLASITIPQYIRILRCDNNNISAFTPAEISIENMVIFSCAHNNIDKLELKNGGPKLRYLDFSYNKISEFSLTPANEDLASDISAVGVLTYLDCSHNKLKEIKIPKSQLRDSLNYFDCSGNEIEILDLTYAGENMYYLNVADNPLRQIQNAPMRYITKQPIENGSDADLRLQIYTNGSGTVDYDLDNLTVNVPEGDKTYIGIYSGDGKKLTENTSISVNGMDAGSLYACFGLLGDANLDGTVNTADAVTILRFAAELTELSVPQMATANMNGDDKVNTADAVQVLRKAAGM